MALTAAERKRLQIQRERARATKQADLVYDLPRVQLGDWLEQNDQDGAIQHLHICYDGMNRLPPDFTEETDPTSKTGAFVFPTNEGGEPSYRGSLGRAELEVELLVEAAKTLAQLLNDYKRSVVMERIAQIETLELDDVASRGALLSEIVMLNKALERLDRSVRADIPQWQLRG